MSEKPFVSTLSTGGFLSLAHGGFRPLGQVQGTAVMSLGYQRKPKARGVGGSFQPQVILSPQGGAQVYYSRGAAAAQQFLRTGSWSELEERTAAYNEARTLALSRLGNAA